MDKQGDRLYLVRDAESGDLYAMAGYSRPFENGEVLDSLDLWFYTDSCTVSLRYDDHDNQWKGLVYGLQGGIRAFSFASDQPNPSLASAAILRAVYEVLK